MKVYLFLISTIFTGLMSLLYPASPESKSMERIAMNRQTEPSLTISSDLHSSSNSIADTLEIYDVRIEGLSIYVYNAKGEKMSSMSAHDWVIKEKTEFFFIVQNDMRIETYDAHCNKLGWLFSTGKVIQGASGSKFTVVEDGLVTVTYDSRCKELNRAFTSSYVADLADVRVDGLRICVYDSKGHETASMSASDWVIAAKTSSFFVVTNNMRIETYDKNCHQLGWLFSTGKVVQSAIGSTFTTEEDGMTIVVYDSKCNKISSHFK